jgi:hypothetical protein
MREDPTQQQHDARWGRSNVPHWGHCRLPFSRFASHSVRLPNSGESKKAPQVWRSSTETNAPRECMSSSVMSSAAARALLLAAALASIQDTKPLRRPPITTPPRANQPADTSAQPMTSSRCTGLACGSRGCPGTGAGSGDPVLRVLSEADANIRSHAVVLSGVGGVKHSLGVQIRRVAQPPSVPP